MKRTILTKVPGHIIALPANSGKKTTWNADFNIAAWFRFKEINNELIKLNIVWSDDVGDQRLVVDYSDINSTSILMSGLARLKIHGQLASMVVEVETSHSGYSVDELFVQPAHRAIDFKKVENL